METNPDINRKPKDIIDLEPGDDAYYISFCSPSKPGDDNRIEKFYLLSGWERRADGMIEAKTSMTGIYRFMTFKKEDINKLRTPCLVTDFSITATSRELCISAFVRRQKNLIAELRKRISYIKKKTAEFKKLNCP